LKSGGGGGPAGLGVLGGLLLTRAVKSTIRAVNSTSLFIVIDYNSLQNIFDLKSNYQNPVTKLIILNFWK